MYAQYLKEKTNDEILETDFGFATYRFLNDTQVYIIDIFVLEYARKTRVASAMADSIVVIAKKRGCTELIGTVVASAPGATDSLKVLLGYGMTLKCVDGGMIVFRKDI